MEEIWKDIEGYEGIYQISNLGRVRSLDRIVTRKGTPGYRGESGQFFPGQILKHKISKFGYHRIGLFKNRKQKFLLIHRLVAKAFIPNPENKRAVNHKNGIKSNNKVQNLEWCTNKENSLHAKDNGLLNIKRGEEIGNSKLTEKQVLEIRKKYKPWKYTLSMLATEYKVCFQLISLIVNYKIWKHIK